jgi:peptidoglycan DL-endopeptidase LytE
MKKSFILAGGIIGSLLASQSAFAAEHVVQKGDSLFAIANKYQTTVPELKTTNHLTSSLIKPGQVLTVSNDVSNTSQKTITYIVKPGDSLSKIAKAHDTTTAALLKLNPSIKNANLIKVGLSIGLTNQTITQKPSQPVVSTSNSNTANKTYVVKRGDTLSGIAKANGTTVASIMALNSSIKNARLIRIGQSIKLSETTATATNTTNHTVAPDPTTPVNTATTEKTQPTTASVNVSQLADRVIAEGAKYLGARYAYGASTSRTDAFDCSSFTLRAFKAIGITLPRTSVQQSKTGTPVPLSQIQKGDLLFFDTDYNGVINHVGIYMGNGKMINAASSNGVSYATVSTGYWKARMVKATRVIQ